MKILLLVPFYHPVPNAASVRAMAFAKYFRNEGAEVEVMTSQVSEAGAQYTHKDIPVTSVQSYDNVRNKYDPLTSALLIPRTVQIIKRRVEASRPDIVMTTSPGIFLAFEGSLACNSLGIPVVFDVRDSWLLLTSTHRGLLSNYLKRRIEGQCCWGAHRVLAVTSMIKEQLMWDHSLPQERIVIASNGADLEMFNVEVEKTYDIVHLGVPSLYRDLENVFAALSILVKRRPSTTIRFIGWNDTGYAINLERLAKELGIDKNIEYIPDIPHSEVPGMLRQARIGLASIKDDAILKPAAPVKVFEYFASGLPVALYGPSSDCELRRLWLSSRAGSYESEPGSFANELERLLTDDELRASCAEKAKKTAQIYDRKAIANKVYHDVISPIVEGHIGG